MLLPLIWLEEFVKVKKAPAVIAEKLLLSGTKVEEIFKEKGETVFNLEITPNRSDELSILGVAREVAAIFSCDLKLPETDFFTSPVSPKNKIFIKIKDKKLCPYYSCVKLTNVKIGPSSGWIQKYLSLSGIRPISNVVDITNFVMLETGQPLHAFDANKIKGSLILRAAKENEVVRTLDSVQRKLNTGAIIIEDEEKLIDLCGLMGGENSEIDETTSEVLLLAPVYDPVAIRKASLFTNLRTEASNRFEKKLDPNLHPMALNRAISLLIEEAGASIGSGVNNFNYPQEKSSLEFPLKLIKTILGIELETEEVINLLSPLGFEVSISQLNEEKLTITIPTFRTDVEIPEDILEEIGRTFGYNNFPKTLPKGEIPVQKETFKLDNEKLLREVLASLGFNETTGYTLVSAEDLHRIGFDKNQALKVLHPTSSDFVYLRPSLLINALKTMAINEGGEELSFFETSKEFQGPLSKEGVLPTQEVATLLVTNKSYGELKGDLDFLLNKYELDFDIQPFSEDKYFENGVNFFSGKTLVAKIGQVKANIAKNFDLGQTLFATWINSEFLSDLKLANPYLPKPKFPPIIEDVSVFLGKETPGIEVVNTVTKVSPLIYQVEARDVFEKEGQKSLTLRINYQSLQKTLTNKEIASVRSKVEKVLISKFKGKIR